MGAPVGTPPAPPRPGRRRRGRRRRPLLVALVVLLLLSFGVRACGAVADLVGDDGDDPAGGPSAAPPPEPEEVRADWHVEAAELRPDLDGAEILDPMDGTMDERFVADAGPSWFLLTGTVGLGEVVLHGLDPASGEEIWRRGLDSGICATDPGPDGDLFCASALHHDAATGLGDRWRLHRIDPATGEDTASAETDAWLSALHLTGQTLVLVEERQPAPHAALRGFTTELTERWSLDLAGEQGHDDLFSDGSIMWRSGPWRDLPQLLDRTRIRDVGPDGTVFALWAGMTTAFVDPVQGELIAMPWCSRLVDDGARLWCNEPDGVTAYSYAGERLYRVDGIRLVFPDTDGAAETDVTRPVFADDDGGIYSVDLTTGDVRGVFFDAGSGTTMFGTPSNPGAYTSDGETFVSGVNGLALLRPRADEVRWVNDELNPSSPPVVRGAEVLVDGTDMVSLTMSSGVQQSAAYQPYGWYTMPIGDELVGVGPDEVALLEIP